MRVLIACETSGELRQRFAELGHEAWSCDLLPADDGETERHIQGDALDVIYNGGPWDMLIAHPPCTYLAGSGLHWNKRVPGRAAKTEAALAFVEAILAAPVPRIAVENPVGAIGTRIRKADQYVQPYEFGDDASKRTGLWLVGLPPLVKDPAQRVPGRIVNGKERWANQTDSGQNRLSPSEDRWKVRSKTYAGIADAMANQWGAALAAAALTDKETNDMSTHRPTDPVLAYWVAAVVPDARERMKEMQKTLDASCDPWSDTDSINARN